MADTQLELLAHRVKDALGSNYDYPQVKRTIEDLWLYAFDEDYQGLDVPTVAAQVRNYWGIDIEESIIAAWDTFEANGCIA